jgi:hypothetical protein
LLAVNPAIVPWRYSRLEPWNRMEQGCNAPSAVTTRRRSPAMQPVSNRDDLHGHNETPCLRRARAEELVFDLLEDGAGSRMTFPSPFPGIL